MRMGIVVSLCLLCCFAAVLAEEGRREKVIIDTDMVECFDDGVALMLLANSPKIEVVGVTTVAGNSWVGQGTAYAVRQLELFGKGSIPVHAGTTRPLRPQRYEQFAHERALVGIGENAWVGCFGEKEPESWLSFYRERYGREPELRPGAEHAVRFIIDSVRVNPGEITLVAIGPCTNIALALRQAPDIARKIKRIVYMGGAFFQPGNVTPSAEFNWWFDPEAARMAVRSDFPEQVAFGLDVCEKVVFTKARHDAIIGTLEGHPYADMLRGSYLAEQFAGDPDFTYFVWDALVAAMLIDPDIVTGEKTCLIDVNDDFGLSYGQSLAYPKVGPAGRREARIILDIDTERFWNLLLNPASWGLEGGR